MNESEKRGTEAETAKESGANPAKDPAGGEGPVAFDPVTGSPIAGGQEEPFRPSQSSRAQEEAESALRVRQAEEERDRALEAMKQAEKERDGALRREEKRLREEALRRVLMEKGLSGDALELAVLGLREEAAGFRYLRPDAGEEGGEALGADAPALTLTLSDESRTALDGLLTGGPLRLLFRLRDMERAAAEAESAAEAAKKQVQTQAKERTKAAGVALANPPLGMGIGAPSREEILSIRDGAERRRAIARNPEVFGL